jgi:calcineurin-like phosphoesterase family protein
MKWAVADWHMGETRMEIMQRPFRDASEQYNKLISEHNRIVKPDDTVYVLGDVVSKSAENPTEWLELIAAFNGEKTLVRGNHDVLFTDEQLQPFFANIIAEGKGIYEEVDGIPLWLTHYPTQSLADRFNIVGHIHAAWKYQLNMLNVGVDVHHFCPTRLDKIPFYLKAISDFYDEDVWVADHPANLIYKGVRGKKGRYFKEPECT